MPLSFGLYKQWVQWCSPYLKWIGLVFRAYYIQKMISAISPMCHDLLSVIQNHELRYTQHSLTVNEC